VNLVSIIIPVAPYHSTIRSEAIAAAHAQTVVCDVRVLLDELGQGPAVMRNRGIAQSDTPFVLFLDADDSIRPDAIERLLASYQQGKYVYCDDMQGDSYHATENEGAYFDGRWHTVTCLVPTVYAKYVGGFDETLPALEDLDFYLKLQAAGVCGVRCPHPLLSYSDNGRRSKDFQLSENYARMKYNIYNRYIGAAKRMCNCGATVGEHVPDGKQEGDILVEALYTPMQMGGPVTGRLYPRPRGHENNQIWVAPADVDSSAGRTRWRVVQVADPNAAPAVDEVMAYAAQAVAR
jgi:hypothetical protein